MPDFKKAREKQQRQYKTQQAIETEDVFHKPDAQTLEHPDVQVSQRSDVQDTRRSDVQTLERSEVQDTRRSDARTSERQDLQASSISDVQKPKPDRNRQTVYLEPDLDDWIREHIIRERKRLGHRVEISDIVNEAVRRYRESMSSA